jgi:hypothetical protein
MPWRRVAQYWALFAVLAAAYWWTLPPAQQSSGGNEPRLAQGPSLHVRVRAVRVEADSVRIEARREGRAWQLSAGDQATDLVVALLEALEEQVVREPILAEPSEADLSAFGLAPPSLKIVLETEDDTPPLVFALGNRNPAGTAVYARRSETGAVYLWGLQPAYYAELLLERAPKTPARAWMD